MTNYSKLIGGVIGALTGVAISLGVPEDLLTEEVKAALTVLLTGVFVYFFPANKSAE